MGDWECAVVCRNKLDMGNRAAAGVICEALECTAYTLTHGKVSEAARLVLADSFNALAIDCITWSLDW